MRLRRRAPFRPCSPARHAVATSSRSDVEFVSSRGATMVRLAVWASMIAGVALAAQAPPQKIVVGSPTLKADETMPRDYTPDGRNLSPPLTWSNLPGATKEIAVICEDPDAGNPPPFVHWVIYNIPADAKGLPEGMPI